MSAAFFNFHPDMVAAAVPGCWEVVDPAELTVVRAAAAATALGELCAPASIRDAAGALPRLRRALSHWRGDGRIMAGANRVLWPGLEAELARRGATLELAEIWQATTTLREHRGDGHVAALVARGIGGCEAHVLAAARGGLPVDILRDNRGWSEAQWEQAARGLDRRGLVGADGTVTEAGLALHRSIEQTTDDLAGSAYAPLTDAALDALYDALEPCARDIQTSGLLPFPNPMGLPRLPES